MEKQSITTNESSSEITREPPTSLPKEFHVKKGDSLLLEVKMDVTEPLDVIWEKNGIMLSDGVHPNFEIGFDGVCNYLKIKKADSLDSGKYEVFGENGDKEIVHETIVTVGDKKLPPIAPKKKKSSIGSPEIKSPPPTSKKPSRQPSLDSVGAKSAATSKQPSRQPSEDSAGVKSPPTSKKPSRQTSEDSTGVKSPPTSKKPSRQTSEDSTGVKSPPTSKKPSRQTSEDSTGVKSPPTSKKPSRQTSEDSTGFKSPPTSTKSKDSPGVKSPPAILKKPKKTPPKTPPKKGKDSQDEIQNNFEQQQKLSSFRNSRAASIDSNASTENETIGKVTKNLRSVAQKISEPTPVQADDQELLGKAQKNLKKMSKRSSSQDSTSKPIPFTIKEKLKPVVIECDDEAVLSVTFSKEVDGIKWYIGGTEVYDSDEHVIAACDNKYTLTFTRCTMKDDKKSVKFIASSNGEELSGSIRMKVQAAVPGIKQKDDVTKEYTEGDVMYFEALIKGHTERYNITWYHGFKKINSSEERIETLVEGNRVLLIVKNATFDDAGVYKLNVKSSQGSSEVKFLPVKIKEKRTVTTHPKRTAPSEPELSRKSSTAASDQTEPAKQNSRLSRDSSVSSQQNDNDVGDIENEKVQHQLSEEKVIAPTEVSETHQEPLTDVAGDIRNSIKVAKQKSSQDVVNKKAFVVEKKLKPVVVDDGEEAILSVTLSEVADEMKWYINGVEVNDSIEHSISSDENVYTLVFTSCSMKDDKNAVKFIAVSNKQEVSGSIRMKVLATAPGLRQKSSIKEEYHTGEDIYFEVIVKGHLEPYSVIWYSGFKKMTHEDSRTEILQSGNRLTLAIKNAILDDAGVYKVKVSSSDGQSELKFDPIKIKEKHTIAKKPKVAPPAPSKPTKIKKDSSAKPKEVEKTEQLIKESSIDTEDIEIVETVALQKEPKPSLEEVSRAISIDSNVSIESTDASVQIKEKHVTKTSSKPVEVVDDSPFVITEKLKPVVVEEGDEAVLSVTLSKQADEFKWLFNNKEVSDTDKYIEEINESTYTFKFIQCNLKDDKKPVKFIAYSNDKELSGSIRMKVQAAVPAIKQMFKLEEAYTVGDDIQFKAIIKGHPEPYKVDWLKGFKKISADRSEVIVNGSHVTLILKNIVLTDAGAYKCTVKSSKTTSELKFPSFKVKGWWLTLLTY